MLPLHRDPHFTFRFADDRVIPASTWRAWRPGDGWRSTGSTPAEGSWKECVALKHLPAEKTENTAR